MTVTENSSSDCPDYKQRVKSQNKKLQQSPVFQKVPFRTYDGVFYEEA